MGKRSWCELTRRAEQALGRPPRRLTVWATLHWLPQGSPFSCGEPGCHLGPLAARLLAVGDHLRPALPLRQEVEVDLNDRLAARIHPEMMLDVQPNSPR